jgi:hypothetical protein
LLKQSFSFCLYLLSFILSLSLFLSIFHSLFLSLFLSLSPFLSLTYLFHTFFPLGHCLFVPSLLKSINIFSFTISFSSPSIFESSRFFYCLLSLSLSSFLMHYFRLSSPFLSFFIFSSLSLSFPLLSSLFFLSSSLLPSSLCQL